MYELNAKLEVNLKDLCKDPEVAEQQVCRRFLPSQSGPIPSSALLAEQSAKQKSIEWNFAQ